MSKPTQQEIIELARESRLMSHIPFPSDSLVDDALNRFATLLLERFGAGGGEPIGYIDEVGNPQLLPKPRIWMGKDKEYERAVYEAKRYFDNSLLYTRPSPSELRAEYERGLEDAAKVCDEYSGNWYAYRKGAEQCAASIRALKGKQ